MNEKQNETITKEDIKLGNYYGYHCHFCWAWKTPPGQKCTFIERHEKFLDLQNQSVFDVEKQIEIDYLKKLHERKKFLHYQQKGIYIGPHKMREGELSSAERKEILKIYPEAKLIRKWECIECPEYTLEEKNNNEKPRGKVFYFNGVYEIN